MGLSRIRLYSRLAALGLAALVVLGVSALRLNRPPQHFGSLTITSYIVAAPRPRHDEPRLRPEPDRPAPALARVELGPPSSLPPPRLWSYSSAGEIVFDHPEQYRRCRAARAERHNESDCPEAHDPHPMVLRPG